MFQFALQSTQAPPRALTNTTLALSVLTLWLGIPSLFVSAPTLPVPLVIRRRMNLPVSKMTLVATAYVLSYLPDAGYRAMCDVLLVLAFLSTFTIPGTSHTIRK